MVSAENGFQWENEDTPYEEKSLLIDSLPEGFKYRVKKQKILEQSEIKEELKFKVEFEVNICDKEEALKFVQLIAAKNDTEMKPTRNERAFKGFVSQRFNCSRNLRTKEGKKSRQHGKSTNCPAFFTYKLYDCQKEEGIECFALKMKIEYDHNLGLFLLQTFFLPFSYFCLICTAASFSLGWQQSLSCPFVQRILLD